MEPIKQHYIIDLSSNNNFIQVPSMQGDGNNVRRFEIELISNGSQYIINKDDTIVSIVGTKPDTCQIFNDCKITDEGYILVDITSQMSAIKGRGDYSIVLMSKSTNSQLKSFPFYILTTSAPFNVSEIVSSDEFQLLAKEIAKAETGAAEVQKAVEKAKNSENNAKTYANSAKTSSDTATTKATEASDSAILSQSWAVGGTNTRDGEDTNNSKYHANQAFTYANNAKTSETNAKLSETEAKTSETNAKNSETIAKTSETNAKVSETNAKTSETNAKSSETEAKNSETNAKNSETIATQNASEAGASATSAADSASTAINKADTATTKATEASNSAEESKSYAVGTNNTFRDNDAIDNSKYYYEQVKGISEGLNGALLPMGTISFSDLQNQTKQPGFMYNISDSFVTDETFKEGKGYTYPAGTNVYYTADGHWDCLAGIQVTGVKGENETKYRNGNVNISKNDIGLSNVENKSAAMICSEITKNNIINALGYIPLYETISNTEPINQSIGDYWLQEY